jgi:dihydropteroate synthase
VFIYGVINASPDSLNTDSIATTAQAAAERARSLIADGADGLDVGGQGSTDSAEVVPWRTEWERLETVVPALAALGVHLSVDTWRPEVARRALEAGATVLNAADGMQSDEMWEVAADFDIPIVLPFLSGPNPREMSFVQNDPVETLIEFFEQQLLVADRFGLRQRCIIDPGTGFAPSNWPWSERYVYQKQVYLNLDKLRRFDLPLYIALPWKETPEHNELLEIVVRASPEFGRAHYPAKVRQLEARLQ